eukprot:CAMPEP_0181234586 /NCGR_PEP_ID=MMETSP1096-20121128/37064_1 /TAXON_ID=156174 ORGANISM="Chrysochromulina ericina, Strain CCMP281" /NCGR_SAMPLE_ID=MMETSP1096 /ASSEMBLY_ACC=CAM_ASM_000453 /LENGTH=48 /DNA_ID= /DNA_START= /DNA_END= /DNA_ORIENTATION=
MHAVADSRHQCTLRIMDASRKIAFSCAEGPPHVHVCAGGCGGDALGSS